MFPGFYIFGMFLSSYAICVIVGIFSAFVPAVLRYKKRSGDDISMIFVLLFGGIGAFVGMHVLFGITNISHWNILLEAQDFLDFIKRFAVLFGGGVFYGGLIGGLAGGYLSMRYQKLDYGLTSDCAAPSIALFHAFGRIGCFFSGCCYGVEWDHGIAFHNSLIESANGVPRVPVQLYEAGLEFVLFALLSLMLNKGWLKNRLLAVYLLIYSVGRFILEFWRGDEYRGFLFGLSTSQLISVAVFAVVMVFLIVKKFRRKPAAPAE